MQYYQNLFSKPRFFINEIKTRLGLIVRKKISDEKKKMLLEEVTKAEIKSALFSMKEGTAPRQDGFTVKFYKKNSKIVKLDLVLTIKSCFYSNNVSSSFSSTILTLVPKAVASIEIKECRPIACYNIAYKCYSN